MYFFSERCREFSVQFVPLIPLHHPYRYWSGDVWWTAPIKLGQSGGPLEGSLIVRNDGNLVLVDVLGGTVWSTNTATVAAKALQQADAAAIQSDQVSAAAFAASAPVDHALIDLLQSPDHAPLLKEAFNVYSNKNKFIRKESDQERGFEQIQTSLTHLDGGELLSLLKGFRIVPKWLSVEDYKQFWSSARYHHHAGAFSNWVDREKSVELLNYSEFLEMVVRLAVRIRFSAEAEETDWGKVQLFMRLMNQAAADPRHDTTLQKFRGLVARPIDPSSLPVLVPPPKLKVAAKAIGRRVASVSVSSLCHGHFLHRYVCVVFVLIASDCNLLYICNCCVLCERLSSASIFFYGISPRRLGAAGHITIDRSQSVVEKSFSGLFC